MAESTRFKPGAANPGHASNRADSGAGRQPGSRNRLTVLRESILNAYDLVGGEAFLVRLARSKKDRHLFVQLLGKALPQRLEGHEGGPLEAHVLHLAVNGIQNLDDAELDQLMRLFDKLGVAAPNVPAANDTEPKLVGSGSAAGGQTA